MRAHATLKNLLLATLLAVVVACTTACTKDGGRARLLGIAVHPQDATMAAGTRSQLRAIGSFDDGSTRDVTSNVFWSSSDPGVAAVGQDACGRLLAEGVGSGSATISADLGLFSDSVTVTVTGATLESIEVWPASPTLAVRTSRKFIAVGLFSDASKQDLSSEVVWSSSDPDGLVFDDPCSPGRAKSTSAGTYSVSATWSVPATLSEGASLGALVATTTSVTVSSATLEALEIAPSSLTVAAGTSVALTATGVFSDGSTQDVSADVSWSSANPGLASVETGTETAGWTDAIRAGATLVTATLDTVSTSEPLQVTSARLLALELAPASMSVPAGQSQALSATGSFSDGSTQDLTANVTWTTPTYS